MRIFDQKHDRALKNITLLLTKDEAKQLLFSLNDMIKSNDISEHLHVNDVDCLHEITLCLYDMGKIKSLNDRIIKLVLDDI